MKRLELTLATVALAASLLALGIATTTARAPRPQTELLEATILAVDEPDNAYVRGETLVQLEDGTRRRLPDVYGDAGDRFMLKVQR